MRNFEILKSRLRSVFSNKNLMDGTEGKERFLSSFPPGFRVNNREIISQRNSIYAFTLLVEIVYSTTVFFISFN